MQIYSALAVLSQGTTPAVQTALCPATTASPLGHEDVGIATQVGSSCYRAIADDALKDEDNAGWVLELEPAIQAVWLQRIRWIRLVDRLAEQGLLQADAAIFSTLLAGWHQLILQGTSPTDHPQQSFLEELRQAWFGQHGQPFDGAAIAAWNQYLDAVGRYHQPQLVLTDLPEYETFLAAIGGGFFQVFPFGAAHQQSAIAHWGQLDQVYNHLRDLHEDMQQGLCYFPTQVLAQFGLTRGAVLSPAGHKTAGYTRLLRFWLEHYLPRLRRKARQITRYQDLHPSWAMFLEWSIARYRRIETTLRDCQFDAEEFAAVYWLRVQADLPHLRSHIRQFSPQTGPTPPVALHPLQSQQCSY